MEPAIFTAAAIATLVITKAFEKTGEKLGEKVLEESGKLLSKLKEKKPSVANAVELAQQQPFNYGEAVLEEVEAAAQADPEINKALKDVEAAAKADPNYRQAIEKLETAIKSQPSTVHNYGKLAESLPNLKAVFQGGTFHGDFHF
jgi:tetratricopeptide (TPR) repeat protein